MPGKHAWREASRQLDHAARWKPPHLMRGIKPGRRRLREPQEGRTRRRQSAAPPLGTHSSRRPRMRPHGLAPRKPLPDFTQTRAVEGMSQLAEQVVREGHTFQRRTRFEFAMQIRRNIPNLNHHWHAMSILACGTHLKRIALLTTERISRCLVRRRASLRWNRIYAGAVAAKSREALDRLLQPGRSSGHDFGRAASCTDPSGFSR